VQDAEVTYTENRQGRRLELRNFSKKAGLVRTPDLYCNAAPWRVVCNTRGDVGFFHSDETSLTGFYLCRPVKVPPLSASRTSSGAGVQ
jgi:hypothetical protein